MASFFGSTGFYIALLLCVVAAVVGGWFWLIRGEADTNDSVPAHNGDSAQETERSAGAAVSIPVPSSSEQKDDAQERIPERSAAAVMPEAKEERETKTPVIAQVPNLIVAPLKGETLEVFSPEMPVYHPTTDDWRIHDGVDIAAAAGTAVVAAAAGSVAQVRQDDRLGTVVVIAHKDGYESTYASLQEEVAVSEGESVSAGQKIGTVGNTTLTESALGAHLHFSVKKDGAAVDPMEYLKQ